VPDLHFAQDIVAAPEGDAAATLAGYAPSSVAQAFFDGRASLIPLICNIDRRGSLLPVDFSDLPFHPCRAFVVQDVPAGTARGGHAHRRGSQLLVRLAGRVLVEMRVGGQQAHCLLDRSDRGLLVGPGVWAQQTYVDSGAILLVFASEPYDPADYLAGPA
jgi:dTDP-4-dehydrorhamnose 3,5-epimerase-like enzyme